MKCPACDSAVSPDFRYCSHCGQRLIVSANRECNGGSLDRVPTAGSYGWLRDDFMPERDAGGEYVTQPRQTDAARQESQERLRLALASANQGLWDLDVLTGVTYVSPEYATMLGFDPDEFVETCERFRTHIHPDDLAETAKAYDDYLSGKSPAYRVEFRLKTRSGDWKWLLSCGKVAAWSDDGFPLRIIGTHTDITEQKEAEENIAMLRDELAHVHRLGVMGELASGLAHELNQPLSALALYASTAQLLARRDESSELRTTVAKIGEQALRAGDIIRGMRFLVNRDYSEKSATDLNHLVHDALKILEHDLKHEMIRVTLQLSDRIPAIAANRIQILQVFVNLIRNAIEAMSATPATERSLTLFTETAQEGVRAVITDTGCGFDDVAARRLFHPFQSSKPIGMGMGLAISRKLIEAHDGKIEARSTLGAGASFEFWLPATMTTHLTPTEG